MDWQQVEYWTGILSPDKSVVMDILFSAIIAGSLVLALAYLAYDYVRQSSRLSKIENNLASETYNSVAENRLTIRERFEKSGKTLSGVWHDFDSNLLLNSHDAAGNEITPQLRNPLMAEDFFNRESLQITIGQSRLLASVPAILTGLGVLGTFIGLLGGLSDLSILKDVDISAVSDINSKNQLAGELTSGIFGMIAGAATAFKTSVWGVVASLFFNIFEKCADGRLHTLLNRTQNRIDDLYCHIDLNEYLKSIEESSRKSYQVIATLAEKIGDKMQESMERAGTTISQALEQSLLKIMTPALEKLANTAQDQVQKASASSHEQLSALLNSFQNELAKAGREQGNSIAEASENMKKATVEMADKFGEISKELTSSIQSASSDYQQSAKNIEQSLSNHADANSKLLGAQAQNTEDLFAKLTSAVSELAANVNRQMAEQRTVNQENKDVLRNQLDEFLAATRNNISMMQQALANSLAEEQLHTAERNKNFAATVDQLNTMLSNTQTSFAQANESQLENNRILVEDLKQITTQFEQIGRANEQAATKLNEAARTLDGTSATFSNVSDRLNTTIRTIDTTISEVTDLAGEICNACAGNVDIVTKSAEELRKTLDSMKTVCDSLNAAAAKTDSSFATLHGQFQELLSVMKEESNEFIDALAQQMEQYHEQLGTKMSEYCNHLGASVEDRMNAWNKQTSEYTTQMTDAIDAISTIVETMETAAKKRQ